MILIIGILLVNKAAYTHVHILPDGSLVTHAHPFSNSDESNKNCPHQHSSFELYLLDILGVLMLCAIAVFILKQTSSNTSIRVAVPNRLLPALVPVSPGRAPPACM